ncbi:nucleotidyl transferase AbiEii/AbiGii toxin family protein [Devosia sp. CAU 1758]
MAREYLHQLPDFADLIRVVGDDLAVNPVLVEKDYWIMHSLYGLEQMGLSFELKGGTSLSKGLGIIHRFSEDIDIRIEPPAELNVAVSPRQQKPAHVESRKAFYDWLAGKIAIHGITSIERDTAFDDQDYYRGGGIRLGYPSQNGSLAGLKDGILLEVGFDDVSPNSPSTVSSWAYDHAVRSGVEVIDNRAVDVACYHPGYTFVEKLQTVSTKFRRQQEEGDFPANFMRHYYDLYCLLQVPAVREFIGTEDYSAHKVKRFRAADNQVLAENQAIQLADPDTFALYADAYAQSAALYYKSQPPFEEIVTALRDATAISGI